MTTTTGEVFGAVEAEDALKTANAGGFPDTASIKLLPFPYNMTACADDATLGIKPYQYNVFCNGDQSVDVSTWSVRH